MILQNNVNLSHQNQAIVALCTAQGAGALGLIRLSGINAFDVADRCARLASDQKISDQATHTISYGWVIDELGKPIDQVLFLIMRAPKTFTGQDVVEITCHNNPFLIERIIDRLLVCGARQAGKGEFAQRAVMLGKMDLLQAEAINDLIHAQTSQSLKYSLQQLQGSFSSWIYQIEQAVLEMIAYCESSFEFLDEEMNFAPEIAQKMQRVILEVEKILKTVSKQQLIKEGIKIALIGSVNVGKSSLFNCLLNKKRSIVTPIAGTTRDSIEASVYQDGDFVTFVDTAGVRVTDDQIEQEGIDRSFEQAALADIILLIIDASNQWTAQIAQQYHEIIEKYKEKIIVVFSKVDLGIVQNLNISGLKVAVSTQDSESIDQLRKVIVAKIENLKGSDHITYLLNKRQHDLLGKFLEQLRQIVPMLERKKVDYELVSVQFKESLQALSEMTGRGVSQAAFDKIFDTFCVGK